MQKYFIIRLPFLITVLISLSILSVSGQPKYVPEFLFGWGPGINISYFDIGGGSPGISFSASFHYRWTKNFMAGISLNYHHSNGTDEGTANSSRNCNFKSNLFETTARLLYLFTFKPLPEKRWKKHILPYIYAGTGCLVFYPELKGCSVPEANSAYSQLAFIMNGGMGLNYILNNNWSIGIEGGLNRPFSDYLEGYSTKKSQHNDSYYNTLIKIIYIVPKITKRPLKSRDFR